MPSWSTIILLSYLYFFFFFYWNTFSLKRACSTGSPVYKVSIKNTKQMNMKFEETEQIILNRQINIIYKTLKVK